MQYFCDFWKTAITLYSFLMVWTSVRNDVIPYWYIKQLPLFVTVNGVQFENRTLSSWLIRMSWLHLNVEQHFQRYQSTPRSQTSTKISSKMISAHFNFPWQRTLVLAPSSINTANNYSFHHASKARCCRCMLSWCSASWDILWHLRLQETHIPLHLFHAGDSHSSHPKHSEVALLRLRPVEKAWTFLRTLTSFSFPPLSSSTPTLLFYTNWGSQAENELPVEVSGDKRGEAAVHVCSCVAFYHLCSWMIVMEMLREINHITTGRLNWWWICWLQCGVPQGLVIMTCSRLELSFWTSHIRDSFSNPAQPYISKDIS